MARSRAEGAEMTNLGDDAFKTLLDTLISGQAIDPGAVIAALAQLARQQQQQTTKPKGKDNGNS
jgi:hypothetical protein